MKSNITNTTFKRNLVVDDREYKIDLTNFDLAYNVLSKDENILNSIDRYVTPIFESVHFIWADDGKSYKSIV